MKKLLWRIVMWRTKPSLRISFEEWDKRRTREKKEWKLFTIQYEISEVAGSVRYYIAENRRCGSLSLDEIGDYYEDVDRLNWLLRRKDQLMFELAQPS